MTEHDLSLRQALHRWPGPEPGAGFDAEVWRRIRSAPAARWSERVTEFLEPLLESRPALAAACTFALLLMTVAVFQPARRGADIRGVTSFSTPTPGGLARAYVHMMSGDPR